MAPTTTATTVRFDPFTPNTLIVCDAAGTNAVWDPSSGTRVRRFQSREVVTAVAFNPQMRNSLIAGTEEGDVEVWDPSTGVTARTIRHHPWPVSSMMFTPDAARVVVGGGTGHVAFDPALY